MSNNNIESIKALDELGLLPALLMHAARRHVIPRAAREAEARRQRGICAPVPTEPQPEGRER